MEERERGGKGEGVEDRMRKRVYVPLSLLTFELQMPSPCLVQLI